MQKWLDVVDANGKVREQWAVIVHNDGERYSIITPHLDKHYKSLKNVEKFLIKFNMRIA